MADRRYYLTTASAYANNRPGLHTLYEVIGADAIARWHRMLGDDTRFLTGTDEYSVNIAETAAAQGKAPKAFVDEMVGLFRAAEDALQISPDRFIRTTDADHQRAVHEMIRRSYEKGDLYLGDYEGWYCPNEGFIPKSQLVEDARGTHCANHPSVELQWLTERNWFFRLSRYQEPLERYFAEHPDWVEPDYRKNEMLGFIRQGLEDFSASRAGATWGIPFPIRADGSSAQLPDGTWDPTSGTVYVWFDALINYITGAGFPDDPEAFARWWPADLHVIGKDINRLHTVMWPAMLMSAGLALPRKVWVHGWLLAQGERMSKSRGNFLDPIDVVAALGSDGARYTTLRDVAFDRDTDVSWDSFVRRYNADLANDFGNLLNRTVTMVSRYLGGERPPPAPVERSALADAWSVLLPRVVERIDGFLLHEGLAELWSLVGAANRLVEAEQPWALAKAARGGDEPAEVRLREVLGDLVEACRVVALAAAPFIPSTSPRVLGQLGYAYPYRADGNGGPPLMDELAWGAHAGDRGRVGTPEPLFPRLEAEAPVGS
ncbi:MAG TPA: methionine--tRNA ligase, partial [Candidatus Dormibacteraeota bacterium]|nr:methionine--tRNA ligase [Candidatus Dormibacteraeota bacterium]